MKEKPLLAPRPNLSWEKGGIFNPGATIFKDKILLLYRAYGEDKVSRFGIATSSDGINFAYQSDTPVFIPNPQSSYEDHGVEDPRVTCLEGKFAIIYTAASYDKNDPHAKVHGFKTRISLAWTEDFCTFDPRGVIVHSYDDKDAALFPQKWGNYYYLYHRRHPSIWLSRSIDLNTWEDVGSEGHYALIIPSKNSWDNDRVGIGAQPIKTEDGWLIFYHARDKQGVYRLGAFLADLENPEKVIAKLPYPILEPVLEFEKRGQVANVVFTCGAVEWGEDYLVYYGAADFVISGGYINKQELLKELKKYLIIN